jgi:membrane protein DedA with SNARE-associated domain
MLMMSVRHLAHLAAAYGPGLIGVIVALEAMGLPLPSETLLIAAAATLGTTHQPGIAWLIVSASAGAIIGDNVGYWVGYTLGWRALRRWGRHLGLSADRLTLGAWLFRRHGGTVVFFGRFIAILRTLAALLAGANRMSWRWFLLCNAAGGIVWASLYGLGAYWLGAAARHVAGPVGIALGIVALAVIVAVAWTVHRNEQDLVERAKREMADSAQPWSPSRPEPAGGAGVARRD